MALVFRSAYCHSIGSKQCLQLFAALFLSEWMSDRGLRLIAEWGSRNLALRHGH